MELLIVRPYFIIAIVSGGCFGQGVSIGAIGGVRLTDDLAGAGAVSVSKRYVIGPTAEIGLPFGLGIEFDSLFGRAGYQTAFQNFASSIFSDERANSWEFPILRKYRLPVPLPKPFVEVGYAPRVIDGTIASSFQTLFPAITQVQYSTSDTSWPVSQGIVVGGGVQFGMGRLRLAPVVRYTHWNNAAVSGYYGDGPSWQSTQNQVDALLGIGWKIR